MPEVLREDRGHVRILTFNRPEKLNALSPDGQDLFSRLLQEFRDDDQAWVLVLTGAGRAFSTGLDMSQASRLLGRNAPTLNGPNALEIWKPVIAALHGHVVGGGCETALACDIRIAAADTRIALAEVRRGLIPGTGGIQRLVRQVAFGDALKILLTGDPVGPEEALRIGLVQEVVPEGEDVKRAIELAERIAENAPLAARAIKEAAYRGYDLPLRSAIAQDQLFSFRNRQSQDAQEGLQAFLAKRPANFQGQ
jgi:enoyl-CoA hydratase/carnithine racemase